MKGKLVTYLAAVFLNLALVWAETATAPAYLPSRPAVVRVHGGLRVTATSGFPDQAVNIGLLLADGLRLRAADPRDGLFPDTRRWDGLEASVSILN